MKQSIMFILTIKMIVLHKYLMIIYVSCYSLYLAVE